MDSTIVKVNVGGTVFTTTRSTLQKANYFKELALDLDLENQVIDRCPRAFEFLLNCLRDRSYIKLEKLEEYRPEINYYGMDCLLIEAAELVPVITVDLNSPFKVVLWGGGIPYLQPKTDLTVTRGDQIKMLVTVKLPYDGWIEIHAEKVCPIRLRSRTGTVNKMARLTMKCTINETFPAGSDFCYLTFHRTQAVTVIQ